jgi:hypothetical protein
METTAQILKCMVSYLVFYEDRHFRNQLGVPTHARPFSDRGHPRGHIFLRLREGTQRKITCGNQTAGFTAFSLVIFMCHLEGIAA